MTNKMKVESVVAGTATLTKVEVEAVYGSVLVQENVVTRSSEVGASVTVIACAGIG